MSLPTPVLRKTDFSSSFSSRRTKPLSLCIYLFTEAKLKAFLFLASPASFEQSGRPISAAKLFGTTRNFIHPQILRSRMALRGVWQLQKLIVNYCDWGGSSRGIRAFMESQLPVFREKNPQLEVVTELIRGQHPLLKGLYKNRSERVICVKNMDPEEVLQHATRLRNSLGRKVVKLRTRHVSHHPSVQGTWTTDVKF